MQSKGGAIVAQCLADHRLPVRRQRGGRHRAGRLDQGGGKLSAAGRGKDTAPAQPLSQCDNSEEVGGDINDDKDGDDGDDDNGDDDDDDNNDDNDDDEADDDDDDDDDDYAIMNTMTIMTMKTTI